MCELARRERKKDALIYRRWRHLCSWEKLGSLLFPPLSFFSAPNSRRLFCCSFVCHSTRIYHFLSVTILSNPAPSRKRRLLLLSVCVCVWNNSIGTTTKVGAMCRPTGCSCHVCPHAVPICGHFSFDLYFIKLTTSDFSFLVFHLKKQTNVDIEIKSV